MSGKQSKKQRAQEKELEQQIKLLTETMLSICNGKDWRVALYACSLTAAGLCDVAKIQREHFVKWFMSAPCQLTQGVVGQPHQKRIITPEEPKIVTP